MQMFYVSACQMRKTGRTSGRMAKSTWKWLLDIWPWIFICLLIIAPVGGGNRGYGAINQVLEDAIDDFVEETLSCREIVGMNLAVVRGNKTLLAKGKI